MRGGRFAAAPMIVAALSLTACASTTHSLAMELPDRTLSGAIGLGSGVRDVSLTSNDGQLACNGVSLLEYARPGCETSGAVRLHCTDGRDITGDWEMHDCESGTGSGRDSAGNPVHFVIGTPGNPTRAAPLHDTHVAKANEGATNPQEHAYLFRLGGGYAAGFGNPGTHFEIVFSDVETGLFITKLDRANRRSAVAFAGAALADGQEAFVLKPADRTGSVRVRRVRIEPVGDGWQFAGGLIEPAGLPVTNLAGQFIGLTNGTRILGARRLRSYLKLVAPDLLEGGVTESVQELGSRIVPAQ